MDIRDVSFKQYACELRRAYWLKLIELQARGNLGVAADQTPPNSSYAQKH